MMGDQEDRDLGLGKRGFNFLSPVAIALDASVVPSFEIALRYGQLEMTNHIVFKLFVPVAVDDEECLRRFRGIFFLATTI